MIDKHPAMILRCSGAAPSALRRNTICLFLFAVEVMGLRAKPSATGGLMIDLSRMKGIRVEPEKRRVRAEPGLTLGEFDRETQAFALATTLGVASTTGIAGLTLGGGLGWLMGKYGLACDNLISADLVTADGRLLRASADENADLFWGIRGGSGNFGVVTSLEYRLRSVGPLILGGAVLYPLAKAKDFLRFFREYAVVMPDELSMQGGMFTFNGIRVIGMAGCYCGPIEEGERALKPLRTFAPPVADLFGTVPYIQMHNVTEGEEIHPDRAAEVSRGQSRSCSRQGY
jgi:hypothetical protein